ncbi:hypothetical protein MMC13_000482 [Lambiella insularis]|nr:hypothetical protein [Lambiella insularis]
MGKRKRNTLEEDGLLSKTPQKSSQLRSANLTPPQYDQATTIQIVVGSYDRILHGVTATIPKAAEGQHEPSTDIRFADTFLFAAHTSAIRCLAISPLPTSAGTHESSKLILASGSTDERINLYHISAVAPTGAHTEKLAVPSLGSTRVAEDPKNKELGSLLHHSSSISALYFLTRSKLLSAAEDNTIAITRTRDWTVLSTIKAPIPKAVGRPSGDTAPLGGTPAGVNDFAVHPSMKLMISVGRGEKSMRLWNLVTGKKAGVLTFEREILKGIGGGKWASGEGRKIEWNGNGDEFVVGFESGAVVFGMDSKPKCRVMPSPITKIHQIRYVFPEVNDGQISDLLAVSTEDGRIVFYSTSVTKTLEEDSNRGSSIPMCVPIGQLGGKNTASTVRIKDFEILASAGQNESDPKACVITASSDGSIRIWNLARTDFKTNVQDTNGTSEHLQSEKPPSNGHSKDTNGLQEGGTPQCGTLLGTYETGNRITCLKAFTMLNPPASQTAVVDDAASDEFTGIADSDAASSTS